MDSITLRSPAKINFCLSVLGRRADGYHDVEMLMQMVDLYDDVTVALRGAGIDVTCDKDAVPSDERNVAWKAAKLMLEGSRSTKGLAISIRKRIPVAAGLAGGSGNAAAVLVAANRLLNAGFGTERLMELGTRIGMDVPFFFSGPTALATGRGEIITPLPPPNAFHVLLVNPGFETSTAWAYQNANLRLTKRVECTRIARLTVSKIAASLHNDLEAVTAAAHPVIREIKDALLMQGAIGACMSGSGPTVFGVFKSETACELAKAGLEGRGWLLYPVKTLVASPLRGEG